MGHKVHPHSFRIPNLKTWTSRWYSKKEYQNYLEQDVKIREMLRASLRKAGVSDIVIERSAGSISIVIHTSKPGMVIGRGGGGIEKVTQDIKSKFFSNQKVQLKVSIQEVTKPMLSSELVCQNMIEQLEKRIPFRRVLKTSIDQVMRAGGKGVKVMVSGRLNGAEIARTEKLHEGKVPLHTLRADIDFAAGTAFTTYGTIGVKVWIYKGEIFSKAKANQE